MNIIVIKISKKIFKNELDFFTLAHQSLYKINLSSWMCSELEITTIFEF